MLQRKLDHFRASQALRKKASQATNYTNEEEIALVKARHDITRDVVAAKDQTSAEALEAHRQTVPSSSCASIQLMLKSPTNQLGTIQDICNLWAGFFFGASQELTS